MMPNFDNIGHVEAASRQRSTSSLPDLSWLASEQDVPMDLVDMILAQSLETSSNVEDVLKATAPSSTTETMMMTEESAVSADEISDFLFELDAEQMQRELNPNTNVSTTTHLDMFEPIPLEHIRKSRQAPAPFVPYSNTVNSFSSNPNSGSSSGNPIVSSPTIVSTIEEGSSSEDEDQSHNGGGSYCPKFRGYQCTQWQDRYAELSEFFDKNGHSSVPHTDSSNRRLARWVKRQRYQYKMRQEGKPSTMTDERIKALESLQFVWDSHGAAWEDRLRELEEFKAVHKHCNVPSNYKANSSLASWCKCQRRQYRLLREGKKSNITQARIEQLERMGFQFNLRVGYQHALQRRGSGSTWP